MNAKQKLKIISEREELICEIAERYVTEKTTIRYLASQYNVSKSTIHKMFARELFYINRILYYEVREHADNNYFERNKRGGAARGKMLKEQAATKKKN